MGASGGVCPLGAGTCLMSRCGSKAPCTDAAATNPEGCADGGLPDFPGYGLVYRDCLLCNLDAGAPPDAAGPRAADAGVAPGADAGLSPAPAKRGSSGCSVTPGAARGSVWLWWLGAVLLLVGVRRAS